MRTRFFVTVATIACCSAPAFSHAFLQHATPGAGATLKPGPAQVALTFSEKLEPVFSGVAVTDSSGRNVEAGAAIVRDKAIVAPLRSLGPGPYRVAWHAVSVDTHRTEGAYSFTVKP